MMTEETEYYALDPDDALTMNLGVNPLLQFGLKTTRARLLNNILNALSVVRYVPFDSNTIGNPAFDPMDVLHFSGGHADETQVSCITSNGLQGATSGIKKQWFDRVERMSDFPLYLYIVAGCAD